MPTNCNFTKSKKIFYEWKSNLQQHFACIVKRIQFRLRNNCKEMYIQGWSKICRVFCTHCQLVWYLGYLRFSSKILNVFRFILVCIGCPWYSWLWYIDRVHFVCRGKDFELFIFVLIVQRLYELSYNVLHRASCLNFLNVHRRS